jgi:hypothetical protein
MSSMLRYHGEQLDLMLLSYYKRGCCKYTGLLQIHDETVPVTSTTLSRRIEELKPHSSDMIWRILILYS